MRALLLVVFLASPLEGLAGQEDPASAFRPFAPAVVGAAAAGTLALTGEWHVLEELADRYDARVTRPEGGTDVESWLQHGLITAGACVVAAVAAWDKRACVPAAGLVVLVYLVRELRSREGLDSTMDVAVPLGVLYTSVRVVGWPRWEWLPW